MWDEPFDTSMLIDGCEIAINCPEEDLERELAAILADYGITYPNGSKPTGEKYWWRYKKDFCYFVQGTIAKRGPKSSTNDRPWSRFKKCTFYGEQEQEEISDESFYAILGR